MENTSQVIKREELSALTYVAKTDIGMRREENQDSFGVIETPAFKFYLVADGMGGVKGGAVASQLAIRVLTEFLQTRADLDVDDISEAVSLGNTAIFERGIETPELAGMGTTVVGLCFLGRELCVVNVGDSRAYRIRKGKIAQLTEDHTLVTELLRSGAISESQVENHPVSHMLTRSLGPTPLVEVDCRIERSAPLKGDLYMLCTDGLYNLINRNEILQIMSDNSVEVTADMLVALANQRGGTDNITLIIVKVGDGFPCGDADEELTETCVIEQGSDTLELQESVIEEAVQSAGAEGNGISANGAAQTDKAAEREVVSSPVIESHISTDNLVDDLLAQSDNVPPTEKMERPLCEAIAAEVPLEPEASQPQPRKPLLAHGWSMLLLVGVFSFCGYMIGAYYSAAGNVPRVDGGLKGVDHSSVTNRGERSSASAAPDTAAPERDVRAVQAAAGAVQPEPVIAAGSAESADANPDSAAPKIEEGLPREIPVAAESSKGSPVVGDEILGTHATGLTSAEIANVSKRKQALRELVASLTDQISSFDKPLSGSLPTTMRETGSRVDAIKQELADVKAELDIATRKLTVWYGRREKLKTTDAIKLATQVSATSEAVREKQNAFQQVTWQYLKEAEVLSYNPNDEEQKLKVTELIKARKQSMSDLTEEVQKAIEEELSRSDQVIAGLTFKRDILEAEFNNRKKDLDYMQALFSSDKGLRGRKKGELVERHEVALAELEELRQLVPDEAERPAE